MLLTIRRYPEPCLRRPAAPVTRIDDAVRALAHDMIETMRHAEGVGLAAPQVGAGLRLVVVDLDPEVHAPVTLINPVIVDLSKEKVFVDEGCLSFPGLSAKVRRAAEATVSALDLDGQVVEYAADGLIARAFQHELDHLEGLTFIEKVAPSARRTLRNELAALEEDFNERVRLFGPPPEGPSPRPVAEEKTES